jgi:hypothetical protein
MKTTEESRVGACSLVCSTLGGKRACCSSGIGLRRMINTYSFTWTYTKQPTSWLMHCWNTFDAKMSHGQTRTHKTHHGPDLGEVTTFPLIVYFVPLHEAHIQMAFCPGTPEITKVGTPTILRSHNFVCRPLIEMKYKAKL